MILGLLAAASVNPSRDFPQRVIYRRCGQDLCARIEGAMAGKPQAVDRRYRRLKP